MVEIKADISGPGAEALKEVASGGRGALRRAFGSALISFGDMLDDQMKLWRFRNLLGIRDKVDRIRSERHIPDDLLQALPFGDAMRTLDAASQEDEDDVQELWARLIVRVTTSSERPRINKLHVELLRSLTPADSALLELLYPSIAGRRFKTVEEINAFSVEMNAKAEAKWRKFSEHDCAVSVQNLIRLRCITATPRVLNADRTLIQFNDRERRIRGALVDPHRFNEVLTQLIQLIYQAAGAVAYDEFSPVALHSQGWLGAAKVGEIDVPELNHMLTPLGLEFMRAVTLDKVRGQG